MTLPKGWINIFCSGICAQVAFDMLAHGAWWFSPIAAGVAIFLMWLGSNSYAADKTEE
jgi:hypothetical protein